MTCIVPKQAMRAPEGDWACDSIPTHTRATPSQPTSTDAARPEICVVQNADYKSADYTNDSTAKTLCEGRMRSLDALFKHVVLFPKTVCELTKSGCDICQKTAVLN